MVNQDFDKFKNTQEKHKSIYLGRNQLDQHQENDEKENVTSAKQEQWLKNKNQ